MPGSYPGILSLLLRNNNDQLLKSYAMGRTPIPVIPRNDRCPVRLNFCDRSVERIDKSTVLNAGTIFDASHHSSP